MRIKQRPMVLLVALAVALMAGCGRTPEPTLSPPSPTPTQSPLPPATTEPPGAETPDTVGQVIEVAAPGRFLVAGPGSDQYWITLTATSELFRLMADATRPVAAEAIQPGQIVEVWFDGPVRESYPMQADALRVIITVEDTLEGAITEAHPVVQTVMQVLRQQIGGGYERVRFVQADVVEWPDACLGITRKEQMCAQVITPGYRIVLTADEAEYVYHTDADASRIILASGPEARVPDASITWRGERAGQCHEATFGSKNVAFGVCGSAPMAGIYHRPDRAEAYARYLATYAPFEAETTAGWISFAGHGTEQATPAVQRMIAEWAHWAAVEAAAGRSGASYGLALTWSRMGGIAGFCDRMEVFVTGDVFATSCKGEVPETWGYDLLTPEEAQQLWGWFDRLGQVESTKSDDAAADSMTVRVQFFGAGDAPGTVADQQALHDFTAQLFARMQNHN